MPVTSAGQPPVHSPIAQGGRRHFTRLGALITIGLLAGCGATAGSADQPVAASLTPTIDQGAEQAPTLASLLGLSGTPEEMAQQVRATETTRQDLIRGCLARQGFEYVPHVAAGELVNLTGLPTHLPDHEFRRQYGYGIATGFENALTLKPSEPTEDPNVAIVAGMSEAEHDAYLHARYGEGADGEEQGGCEGEATALTDTAATVIAEFSDELAELRERVAADPRLVAAARSWVDCLAAAGYPFPDEVAIRQEVTRQLNPLMTSLAGEEVPEGVVDFYRDRSLTGEQAALLADARTFELAVANADQDCREQAGLDQVRREVRDELEATFVVEHQDRLAELLPAAG